MDTTTPELDKFIKNGVIDSEAIKQARRVEIEAKVRQRFDDRQRRHKEDGSFYNFCAAIKNSHASPELVARLFTEFRASPFFEYEEEALLAQLHDLARGAVWEMPEPERY